MLTEREIEVLKLRKQGKNQAAIALELNISQPAVSNFERNANRKISQAKDMLSKLKDLGLLLLMIALGALIAPSVSAANPGHGASSIEAGTFESGNYVFPAQLDVSGNFVVNSNKFFINATSGYVGIGTTTPETTLDLKGDATQQAIAPTVIGGLIDSTYINVGVNVFATGDYVYVVGETSDSLGIIDVSNKTNPVLVGGIRNSTLLNGAGSVVVYGKYAYVLGYNGDTITVIDITNPSAPIIVGSLTDSTNLNGPNSLIVAGQYAYVVGRVSHTLAIVDIGDPTTPKVVGSVANSTYMNGPFGLALSGDYAFVTSDNNNSLVIVNISNKTSPIVTSVLVNSTAFDQPRNLQIAGRYAYVAGGFNDLLTVVDIGNITTPTIVATLNLSPTLNSTNSIALAGSYLYITAWSTDNIGVVDISNPLNPQLIDAVSNQTYMDGANRIAISGKYAYVIAESSNSLAVVRLTGWDTPTITTGSIDANTLTVDGLSTISLLGVRDGLTVGSSGIKTDGSLAVEQSARILGILNASSVIYTPQICLNGDCQTSWPTNNANVTSTGNGTAGYVPKFTNSTNIETGIIYDNGTAIGVNTGSTPNATLHVNGRIKAGVSSSPYSEGVIVVGDGGRTTDYTGMFRSNMISGGSTAFLSLGGYDGIIFYASAAALGSQTERMRIDGTTGRLGINTTSPNSTLHVIGEANISGTIYTPQICLNGTCRTSWSNANITASYNGTSGWVPSFTNSSNLQGTIIYANSTTVSINGNVVTIGGNARGANATDLQYARASSTQVASGNYSVITGGDNNTASGKYSVISGGSNNSVGIYSVIGGGRNNLITVGADAVIAGGDSNYVGQDYSAVLGGLRNNASAGLAAILGGQDNNASGTRSSVLGGISNLANGSYSMAGGISSIAQGYNSFAIGRYNTEQGTPGSSVYGDQVFIIGNGTSTSARATTFYVTNNGTVWTGGNIVTPSLCLNGNCRTSWPSGGSGNITGAGIANRIPFWSNDSNIGSSFLEWDTGTTIRPVADNSYNLGDASYQFSTIRTANVLWQSFATPLRIGATTTFGPTGDSIYFQSTHSGALVTRWGLRADGHWFAGADNTYDIGFSGSSRPRTIYVGTSIATPQLCLNGDCQTSWPSSGSGNTTSTGNGTAGYLARFTNSTNIETGAIYDDGSGSIGIGTQSPNSALEVYSDSITLGDNGSFTFAMNSQSVANGTVDFVEANSDTTLLVMGTGSNVLGKVGIGDVFLPDETARLVVSGNVSAELVTNGDFTGSTTGWDVGTGWTYGSNQITHTPGNTAVLQQDIGAVEDGVYFLVLDVASSSQGILCVGIGDTWTTIEGGDNGQNDHAFRALNSDNLTLDPNCEGDGGQFDGIIDNITVVSMDPILKLTNPAIEAGDDYLVIDGEGSIFTDGIIATNGIGVGTSNPAVGLDFGDTEGDTIYLFNDGGDIDGWGQYPYEMRSFMDSSGGSNASFMTWGRRDVDATFNEFMRLNGTGSLGIGTNTSLAKLTVYGDTGADQVTNGDFTGSATGWNVGTGWTYGSNAITHTPGNTALLQQNVSITPYLLYRVDFAMSGGTQGSICLVLGDNDISWDGDDNGNHTAFLLTYSTANLSFDPNCDDDNGAYDGTIDNVTVRYVPHQFAVSNDGVNGAGFDGAGALTVSTVTGVPLLLNSLDSTQEFGISLSRDWNSQWRLRLENNNNDFVLTNDQLDERAFTITQTNNNFGIGMDDGDAKLSVWGDVGAEQVTNGDFTGSATGWNLGTGWSYGSDAVTHASGNTALMQQNVSIEVGRTYYVQFTMSGGTQGGLCVSLGDDGDDWEGDDTGIQYFIASADDTSNLTFDPSCYGDGGIYDGTIDNVIVMEVFPVLRLTNDLMDNNDDSLLVDGYGNIFTSGGMFPSYVETSAVGAEDIFAEYIETGRLQSNYDLGVSPSDFDQQFLIETPNADGHVIRIGLSEGGHIKGQIQAGRETSDTTGYLSLRTRNGGMNERLRINSLGYVGINTTSPNSTLHVIGNANITGIIYTPQICLNGSCQTSWPSGSGGWTNNSENTSTTLNVGIGTTAPDELLEVNGSGDVFIRTTSSSSASGVVLDGVSSSEVGYLRNGTETWWVGLSSGSGTTGNFNIYNEPRSAIDFTVMNQSGYVGIGIASPSTTLHVNGTLRISNGTYNLFRVNSSNNQIRFGDTDTSVAVFVNGTINATGSITQNSGFDVAEMFSAEESMSSGELVIATGRNTVRKATKAEADLVIGAVSTEPGFILANPELPNPILIGLAGRIPVKVTGQVQRGDFITVSDTPGVGERATSAGFVIGRALEDSANGEVMIIIQPYYFNPSVDSSGAIIGGSTKKQYFEDKSLAGLAVKSGELDRIVQEAANKQYVPTAPASGMKKQGSDVILNLGTQTEDIVVTLG